jgi:Cof subfamily protein (haloacid dehalogenase superfamily)
VIKLIASDMDGTLLNNKSVVSQDNIAAIEAAHRAHIKFVVATGRGLSEAAPLVQELNQRPDFITLNGALVYNQQLQPVVKLPITNEALTASLNILAQHHLYYEIVTTDGIYSTSRIQRIQNTAYFLKKLNPTLLYKMAVARATSRSELMNITYVNNFAPLLKNPQTEVMKILTFKGKNAQDFSDARQELQNLDDIIVTSSSPNNIEINSQKAQKGIALTKFAAEQDIQMQEVMAIGDNLNDQSMILAAGIGVAMDNAIEPIKEIAQYQTSDNNHNGVAQAIWHAIKLNRTMERNGKNN